MARPDDPMSPALARAIRWAAVCHEGQVRKGSSVPYVEHAVGVAMILDRLGFEEEVVIAGLLHDVVEDTEATLDDVESRFGPRVAAVVGDCSEVKTDAQGNKRPWLDRKRDHLAALEGASVPTRAVILADKLHNLLSIELDLRDGRPVWSLFNAAREQVAWYYRAAIDQPYPPDDRLERLASSCRDALARVEAL